MRRFAKRLQRGTVPPPHKKEGRLNYWRKDLLEKQWAEGKWPGKPEPKPKPKPETKKPDERANAHQAKSEPSAKRTSDDAPMPRRKQKVNASHGEVRHAES
jgi:hypothetical protein